MILSPPLNRHYLCCCGHFTSSLYPERRALSALRSLLYAPGAYQDRAMRIAGNRTFLKDRPLKMVERSAVRSAVRLVDTALCGPSG
jgi:hypothetical protein